MERTNQQRRQIAIGFLLSLLSTMIFPLIAPSLKLAFFAPFLVVLFYKRSLISCLGWAVGCGLIIDLLSGYSHLGLHALSFTITSLLLFPQRKNFFEDSLSTLPVMTAFYSALSTLLLALLLHIFEQPIPFSAEWFVTDIMIYPACDALYAYLFFILPGWVMPKMPKHEYFL